MKKYYVTMTDKFLSGWGEAEGKTNKLVFECDSYDEAERVARYANTRSEMKHINISFKKPYYRKDRYYTSYCDKSNCAMWYR